MVTIYLSEVKGETRKPEREKSRKGKRELNHKASEKDENIKNYSE